MLFLTNFQHVNGSFMKKNGHPWKLTLTKMIFWSLSRQTVFFQNLFNHIRLLICGISDTSNNFFSKEFYLCMFVQFLLDFSLQIVCFAQVLAFSKVAKIKGKVFVALRASQGDLEPSKVTTSPQSPCSLIPDGIQQHLPIPLHFKKAQFQEVQPFWKNYGPFSTGRSTELPQTTPNHPKPLSFCIY